MGGLNGQWVVTTFTGNGRGGGFINPLEKAAPNGPNYSGQPGRTWSRHWQLTLGETGAFPFKYGTLKG